MASELFVDTSGFYASVVRRDTQHGGAPAEALTTDEHFAQAGFVTLLRA